MTTEIIDPPKETRPPPTLVSAAVRTHLMQVVHAYRDMDEGRNTLRARRIGYAITEVQEGRTDENLSIRSAVHAALAPEVGVSSPTEEAIRVVRRAFGRLTSSLYTNEQLLEVIRREFGASQRFDPRTARSVLDGVRITP